MLKEFKDDHWFHHHFLCDFSYH